MRLNRHQFGASAVRLVSVTAAAATVCALWAGTASAANASVAKHSTKTAISISPKSQWVGSSVKLSASVTSSGGTTARGKVTFKAGSVKLCSGRLVAGATHCRVSFPESGTYAVKAYYGGNATHDASVSSRSLVHVFRSPTVTTITNTNPTNINVGQSVTFHVNVGTAAGAPAASGNVVIAPTSPLDLPSSYSCTAPVSGGTGSCTVTPADYGIVSYAATFQANSEFQGSTSGGTFDLAVLNVTTTTIDATSTTVGDVSITATVYAMGANIIGTNGGTGSVTIYIGTTATNVAPVTGCAGQLLTTFTGGPDFDNTFTCKTNTELNKLAAGNYFISAVFSGDPVNEPSNSNPPVEITLS